MLLMELSFKTINVSIMQWIGKIIELVDRKRRKK